MRCASPVRLGLCPNQRKLYAFEIICSLILSHRWAPVIVHKLISVALIAYFVVCDQRQLCHHASIGTDGISQALFLLGGPDMGPLLISLVTVDWIQCSTILIKRVDGHSPIQKVRFSQQPWNPAAHQSQLLGLQYWGKLVNSQLHENRPCNSVLCESQHGFIKLPSRFAYQFDFLHALTSSCDKRRSAIIV